MKFKLVRGKHPLSIHFVWMFILIGLLGITRFIPLNKCPFHAITGYPCLSCGATRAAEAFLAGDFIGMIAFNPLIVLFCIGLFFFSLFKLVEFIFQFRIIMRMSSNYALAVRLLAVIAVIANWAFLIVMER